MKKLLVIITIIIIMILLMTGCSSFAAPADAIRYDPPPQYKQWWDSAQTCIQKEQKRKWNEIEWYHVDTTVSSDGAVGLTHNNMIFISDWYVFDQQGNFLLGPNDRWIFLHELVHAIDKINGHPYDPFYRCRLMNTQNSY